ncbi:MULTISPECIES: TRAP transporter small permease [unclassified Pasteurella]|uniref:TRAP transporter small permease n=1 Tax=unclassified Pasteurella TaxID=2621516 RepID=UPI001073566E|nr:TRAP transporter small permease [Pasteurella sp. 19428wF3_WM03]TFU51330.1 TRAP transporter small permease [Pasteurella sp. WM03]
MKAFAQVVGKVLEALVVFILSVMSILVFLNVVLRYGFNSGISVTEEVSRYMFIWLTFLAAVLAFNENQHVNVTILTDKLSPNGRNILGIFTDSLMLYCCYLIVDGSWIQFQLNLSNLAPISGLPQGITYFASVVAGILIGILLITRLISKLAFLTKGEKA